MLISLTTDSFPSEYVPTVSPIDHSSTGLPQVECSLSGFRQLFGTHGRRRCSSFSGIMGYEIALIFMSHCVCTNKELHNRMIY